MRIQIQIICFVAGILLLQEGLAQKTHLIPPHIYRNTTEKEADSLIMKSAVKKTIETNMFAFMHDSIFTLYASEEYERAFDSLHEWKRQLEANGDTNSLDYLIVLFDHGMAYYLAGGQDIALHYYDLADEVEFDGPHSKRIRKLILAQRMFIMGEGLDLASMPMYSSSFQKDSSKSVLDKHSRDVHSNKLRFESKGALQQFKMVMAAHESKSRKLYDQTESIVMLENANLIGYGIELVELMIEPIQSNKSIRVKKVMEIWGKASTCQKNQKLYFTLGGMVAIYLDSIDEYKSALNVLRACLGSYYQISARKRKYIYGDLEFPSIFMLEFLKVITEGLKKMDSSTLPLEKFRKSYETRLSSSRMAIVNAFLDYYTGNLLYATSYDVSTMDSALIYLNRSLATLQDIFLEKYVDSERIRVSNDIASVISQGMEISFYAYHHSDSLEEAELFFNHALKIFNKGANIWLARQISTTPTLQKGLLDIDEYRQIHELKEKERSLVALDMKRSTGNYDFELKGTIANLQIQQKNLGIRIASQTPFLRNLVLPYWQGTTSYIQSHIEDDEAFLLLYEMDGILFKMGILKDTLTFDSVHFGLGNELGGNNVISDLTKVLHDPEQSDSARSVANRYLSRKIWPFPAYHEDLPSKIWIIPNGDLWGVPFDALTYPSEDSIQNPDYFIYHHETSLIPGFQYWKPSTEGGRNGKLVGIFPGYQLPEHVNKDSLSLEEANFYANSGTEYLLALAEDLSEKYDFQNLQNDKCTKENILGILPHAGVLYFGAHMTGDRFKSFNSGAEVYPDVAVEGSGKLYAFEIYDMDIPAEMVILGGCNSGIGRHSYGEGLLSLARAFLAAGSKSVLMAQWEADEAATSTIHKEFIRLVLKGWSKSEALREAKLDYLRNIDNPRNQSPYFWAAFQVIGSDAPLPKYLRPSRVSAWALVAFLVAILLISRELLRRSRKLRNKGV